MNLPGGERVQIDDLRIRGYLLSPTHPVGSFSWSLLRRGKAFRGFEEQIGRLLRRSDVTCAGAGYCAALASLNSAASVAFLEEYLDYNLTRADLWFDQGVAMAALGYLDLQNRTTRRALFEPQRHRFIQNKPHWDLARHETTFRATVEAVETAGRAA